MEKFIFRKMPIKDERCDIISSSFKFENKALNIRGKIESCIEPLYGIQDEYYNEDQFKINYYKKLEENRTGSLKKRLFRLLAPYDQFEEDWKNEQSENYKNKKGRLSDFMKFRNIAKDFKNKLKNKINFNSCKVSKSKSELSSTNVSMIKTTNKDSIAKKVAFLDSYKPFLIKNPIVEKESPVLKMKEINNQYIKNKFTEFPLVGIIRKSCHNKSIDTNIQTVFNKNKNIKINSNIFNKQNKINSKYAITSDLSRSSIDLTTLSKFKKSNIKFVNK